MNNASIEINLKSFPKHTATLYEGKSNKGTVEIEDGLELAKEYIDTGSVFNNIKMIRMMNKAVELFAVNKITIEVKE